MRELSLFSGAGGGLLGSLLLGWKPIGYVEFNDYCQRVIAQRIADGTLPNAPIFTDVREFVQSGAARVYRGFVDVVTAGFPCQPFSVAGKRKGADDERNMWPATIATIREVRPRFAFLENVPGLVSSGYFGTILGDLAESGYDARWRILSAAELGAPHKRDRLWIVAHAQRGRRVGWAGEPGTAGGAESENSSGEMGDTSGKGLPHRQHAALGRSSQGDSVKQPQRSAWWATEPDVGRLAHGIPNRLDRLKAAGNAQVPICMATAFRLLTEGLDI